ncbi:hypothetical protein D915_011034 [Fasciola hepatica]|uniref:CUB domain-containing protein n=1 Tax=Fasciola hepatica TaxID=6192 RepID=A0A4E0QXJ7_FASHE|nr:hypothetical protein D915_011034 [Fasciola hepatica]
MALKTGSYLFYALSILFSFVNAQPPVANCGNQSLHLRDGQNTFTIPERDGPRECVYNLTSENDTIINFIFVTMSIGTKDGKCDQDYITVGDSENDLPHPRYIACGRDGPKLEFYSTGNRMTVKLVVKSQLDKVSVSAVAIPIHIRRNVLPECGNHVIHIGTGRTEFIFPPTGISLRRETSCGYFLVGNNSGDGNMTFRFQSLNIPNKDKCNSDFVNVVNEEDFVLARLCGTTTPSNNITAAGNALTIEVQVRTNPANSLFKGYIYHESSKPIHETSTSAPILTTVGTTSAQTGEYTLVFFRFP